jgi:hypothetical protein
VGEILAAEKLSLAGQRGLGRNGRLESLREFSCTLRDELDKIVSASVLGANASGFHDFGLSLTETPEALAGMVGAPVQLRTRFGISRNGDFRAHGLSE